ncbi:MAG: ABC transporter ATP-binding protein/permease [Xanthomonadaceae bacterium]|nr:ABC transporter ATP-binding protein/permease [Xanthomonadaceae bacterium]
MHASTDPAPTGSPARQSYARLLALLGSVRPSAPALTAAAVLSIAGALASLAFPLLTQRTVDALSAGEPYRMTALLLVVALLAGTALSAVAELILAHNAVGIAARLRERVLSKLLRLPVRQFDEGDTGTRVSRVVSDCEALSQLGTQQVVSACTGIVTLVGAVAILAWLDGALTLVLIGSVAVAFVLAAPAVVRMESVAADLQARKARLGGVLTQVFSEIRLVKSHGAERAEAARCTAEVGDLAHQQWRMSRLAILLESVSGLAVVFALVVILVYGGMRVGSGDLSMGTFTAFVLYIFSVAGPLGQIGGFVTELQAAKGASARLSELLDAADEDAGGGTAVPGEDAPLALQAVRFTYPGRVRPALDGLDLVLAPGTTTALVGASGAGKSTVMSLILRFHAPEAGRIVYGERSIDAFDLPAWRGLFGYVAQHAPIMPGTIRDNIRYGAADLDDRRVREAAEAARALSFIEALPEGFDTRLTEQGGNLSGGQRQRINIARVFARDPRIVLLDEATASLDTETEHAIQQALERLMRGRTNLVIAHRLSTVLGADRICMLEDGRITGSGTHAVLYAQHAGYRALVDRQFAAPSASRADR